MNGFAYIIFGFLMSMPWHRSSTGGRQATEEDVRREAARA